MQHLLKAGRIAAAAAVLIALSLLAWQCLSLFTTGTGDANRDENGLLIRPVYSREDVAQRLDSIAVPLAVCGGVLLLSLVLHAAAGPQPQKPGAMTPENRLRLVRARIAALPEEAVREARFRRRLTAGLGAAMAALGLLCLVYLLDSRAFPHWTAMGTDAVMGRMLLHVVPPSAAMLLLGIGLAYGRQASIRRELALLQGLPNTLPAAAPTASPGRPLLRVLLYALALAFILLGVMNGGLRDVLYKAIHICTECIGLG